MLFPCVNAIISFPFSPLTPCTYSHLPLALPSFLFAFFLRLPSLFALLQLLKVSILLTKAFLFLLLAISPLPGHDLCCFYMAFLHCQPHWPFCFIPSFESFSSLSPSKEGIKQRGQCGWHWRKAI